MVRNLKFHFLVGGFAFLFTFFISVGNNTKMTSLSRSIFGFLLFFIMMFPIHWFLLKPQRSIMREENMKRAKVNIQTPDEDLAKEIGLHDDNRQQDRDRGGFTPLSPPVLKKKQDISEPMSSEEIANAIRVLSSQ